MNAAELRLALQKLRVLTSVLIVAAHPDDENTALITYLESGRLARVGYLSMNRGSGGQNLIGSETGEDLGVIRTQELLAARSIDGAEQFFTRAIDFGYSKSADETMAIWGKDAILSDVVWVIRSFRPDVIVTRFPTDARGGHGHHQASAILAKEAFRAAVDPKRYPEQLRWVKPWQAKRIVWNAFRPDTAKRDPALPPLLTLDLGDYNALLGKSYTELSAASRSMHKSQGFGAAERRGPVPNLFEHMDGDPAKTDILEGVTTGWSRVPGGAAVDSLLAEAERRFEPEAPHRILPLLVRARAAIRGLGADPLMSVKQRELDDVIRSCAGLWVEAVAERPFALPGGALPVRVSVLNRSEEPLLLEGIEMPNGAVGRMLPDSVSAMTSRPLERNVPVEGVASVPLPRTTSTTQPFWLRERPGRGAYVIADPKLRGPAENPPALTVRFAVVVRGEKIVYESPVLYRWTDRVLGERYRPIEIAPPVTLRFEHGCYLFADASPRDVRVIVESPGPAAKGTVRLELPRGWTAAPAETAIAVAGADAPVSVRFRVRPPAGAVSTAEASVVAASMSIGGARYGTSRTVIDYPHIPVTALFPPAEAHLVHADVGHAGSAVGYVMGSGDDVPAALEQMGYRVTLLSDADIESQPLEGFDAIVVGVRAYNTRPRLKALQERLLGYVSRGGRLVVQYNTVEDALQGKLGPYPFQISRDRVTVEGSPIKLEPADHPLWTTPNRIGAADFQGWVQERGLYFANPWDSKYETPLSMNDPGESPMKGSVLYGTYGKGTYVYTGISWFRQLPAGVPGAYRIFANLVSPPATRPAGAPPAGSAE
jgi:LmbE family N-acetylglucosaminyl deacetylase